MKLLINVFGAPYSSSASVSAIQYVEAALDRGHTILRVFFYHDGVHTANALIAPPQDETDIASRWQQLASDHDIDMVACVASCLRRGVMDETEAERYDKTGANIHQGFQISGLGQMIDATMNADKIMTFGD